MSVLKPVFKKDGNLDFNIDMTKILAKGPTTEQVLYRSTWIGNDIYIKNCVVGNCLKIMVDMGKH